MEVPITERYFYTPTIKMSSKSSCCNLGSSPPDKRLPESLRKLATAFAFIWFPVFCLGLATTIIYAQTKQTPGTTKSVADTCPLLSMGNSLY